MEWKNIFKILLFTGLFSNSAYAQIYKIDYRMNYRADSLSEEMQTKDMVLLIKEKESKFYSRDQYLNDSLVMAKEQAGAKAQKKYDYQFMTIRDQQQKKIYRFTVLLRDLYRISEKSPLFKWEITKDTKEIGDYTCQKAVLTYSGRTWEAWFTTDVALQNGPYVFDGLPGLIVSMKDSKNNYQFALTAIKKDETISISYFSTKPLDVTWKQWVKVQQDYYNDPYREMKSGNIKAVWQDENGKRFVPDYKELTKTQQQYLKKNNNPIELDNAIHYR
ncbi:GLPGLI family protein [Chryseobacterium sp. SN22]|uniref:GLPGLI family protein n=1 Tax=Chryseobacterium sp. SN22 TaxID=2606431 RepID=UPI0011EF65A2|nr:GLPGLI family protein [Chryseobacterium sp. SN22]KAA0130695.1 GLPGLI family protein [Chryseobacterium sp. SN22]